MAALSPEPPQRLSPASDPNSALRPISQSSQKVSLHWDDVDDGVTKETSTTMQFGLAECVETKTVTTTTTTKRTFPPFFVRQARPLHSLDQKEYPLAHRETPQDLANISWDLNNYIPSQEEEDTQIGDESSLLDHIKAEPANEMTPQDSPTRPARRASYRSRMQRGPRPPRMNLSHAVTDKLRRNSRHVAPSSPFPTTPDTSDISLARVINDAGDSFGNDVPTPPIERCPAPFAGEESSQESVPSTRPTRINTVAAQSDTLPSPGLSPTLAATDVAGEVVPWDEDEKDLDQSRPSIQAILQQFDQMPDELQGVMVYQMLRRCPRKILRLVANVVNPALKCDFLKELPTELSLMVLSHLDHRDLCRAAQVSKYWRNMVDTNETGWKELMDRDGLEIPPGELERAIKHGWGWQDPEGYYGGERDVRPQARLKAPEQQLHPRDPQKRNAGPQLRKRKRTAQTTPIERSKRRASGGGHAPASPPSSIKHQLEVDRHRSEGPIAHATAAALAVPDPELGLPSLRKLHLYKSLYRRQHMIKESWTNKKVKPSHVAFAAHPRHVITCLQFDDDKIISGSDDTFIHVYDTKTGELRKKLEGHEGGVWALHYVGNTLVSGSTDRTVRVWDIEKGVCTHVFHGHTSTVRCLQILMPTEVERNGRKVILPEYPLIITGSRDSQLRVWRLPEEGAERYIPDSAPTNDQDCPYFVRALTGHTHSVRAIAAYGDILVSGSYDSTVRVWKISTGESLHALQGHQQKVYSVVLDHKRNRCISGSMDSNVRIWDLATGNCLHTLEGHTLLVGLLDLQDERLVSAAADSTLRIWDPETGRCKNILSAHTGAITCFQHDSRKVISGSEKTVKMWDIQTGECVQDLLTDLTGVWQVSFDSRRCVAAVQRNQLTYLEILDFGAARDGKHEGDLGQRVLLNPGEVERVERIMSEEDA